MTKEEAIKIYISNTINGPHPELWMDVNVGMEFMIQLHKQAKKIWGNEDYTKELTKLNHSKHISWEIDGCCIHCKITPPNTFNIENTFRLKEKRNWPILYVVVDLHGTIIKPEHDRIEFYPNTIEVMKWFNGRNDFKTILWTSSFPEEIDKFKLACNSEGIRFDFVNENPLEVNSNRANFEKKFYFNILFDDKSGFDGTSDWKRIRDALVDIGEW